MEKYKFFLQDLVVLLKEKLEQAKINQSKNREFDMGVSMGLYEGLDLIKQQANAFDIPLEDIGLKDYHLESYL